MNLTYVCEDVVCSRSSLYYETFWIFSLHASVAESPGAEEPCPPFCNNLWDNHHWFIPNSSKVTTNSWNRETLIVRKNQVLPSQTVINLVFVPIAQETMVDSLAWAFLLRLRLLYSTQEAVGNKWISHIYNGISWHKVTENNKRIQTTLLLLVWDVLLLRGSKKYFYKLQRSLWTRDSSWKKGVD